jgi:hypothetical protein
MLFGSTREGVDVVDIYSRMFISATGGKALSKYNKFLKMSVARVGLETFVPTRPLHPPSKIPARILPSSRTIPRRQTPPENQCRQHHLSNGGRVVYFALAPTLTPLVRFRKQEIPLIFKSKRILDVAGTFTESHHAEILSKLWCPGREPGPALLPAMRRTACPTGDPSPFRTGHLPGLRNPFEARREVLQQLSRHGPGR